MKKITLSIFTAGVLLSPAFGAEDLGEVVVTSSSKVAQKIKETTQNVTIVTAEDIEEKGYQSVPEILSHTAGFTVVSNGGAGQPTSVYIRGLGGNNLLVLLDGVPLTDYTQPGAAAALEHISLDSIDRVEIIKGGQSGVWGASAAAGTINIITKGHKEDKAALSLKLGSHSTRGAGVDFAKNLSKGGFALGVHINKTDGISTMAPKSAEKDYYENVNYYLNGDYNINPQNSISIFLRGDAGKYDYDDKKPNDTSAKGKNRQRVYGLGYHYQNGVLSIDARASYRKIVRELSSNSGSYDSTARSTNFSLVADYKFNDKADLTFGGEYIKNKGNYYGVYKSAWGTSIYKGNSQYTNKALFASYTQRVDSLLGADTTFNAVVRYDKFDNFKNKTTYRFGIKRDCKVIEGLHSSANIYTGYQAPSIFQFEGAIGKLKPESLKGYDISIGYKNYLNITYFSNKIKDKILSKFNPAKNKFEYYNSKDGVKTTGIEVSSEYAFGDSGFVIGANWTHMFKYLDDKGKKALKIPQNKASVYLDYYFGEASHIGIVANYIGKRRDLYFDPNTFATTEKTLGSYTTVDLTYNTTFKNNLKLNVTLKNIFDKKYQTVYNYNTEGRSVYATVEYKF